MLASALGFLVTSLALSVTAKQAQAFEYGPPEFAVDHEVTAGAVEPGRSATEPARFDYAAYYPTDLRVHQGDVVRIATRGFHTVTISPEGEPRDQWIRRDEVEGTIAWAGWNHTADNCAPAWHADDGGTIACWYDGDDDTRLNSGWLQEGPWDQVILTVDAPVGTYDYYCTIHTAMQGSIEVVPDEVPVLSAQELAEVRKAELAADTAKAVALFDAPAEPGPTIDGDVREWTVEAGRMTDDHRVHLMAYFPQNLTVDVGDRVRFIVPEVGDPVGGGERGAAWHTVTVNDPLEGVGPGPFIRYVNPMCDPDDPRAGAPGVPQQWLSVIGVLPCPLGSLYEPGVNQLALDAPTRVPLGRIGAGVPHDSGWLTAPDATCRGACHPWGGTVPSEEVLTFTEAADHGYLCAIHGAVMGGAISVVG